MTQAEIYRPHPEDPVQMDTFIELAEATREVEEYTRLCHGYYAFGWDLGRSTFIRVERARRTLEGTTLYIGKLSLGSNVLIRATNDERLTGTPGQPSGMVSVLYGNFDQGERVFSNLPDEPVSDTTLGITAADIKERLSAGMFCAKHFEIHV